MHKNIIIGFLAVALLITISVLVYRTEHSITPTQLNDIQVTVSTTTPYEDRVKPEVIPSENTVVDISKIDYSSLEKDRLYTEEEGKFENLSEAGQRLVRGLIGTTECKLDVSKCYENELIYSSIVSLKGGILVLLIPSIKGYVYTIYDLNQKEHFVKNIYNNGLPIRNDQFVIVVQRDVEIVEGYSNRTIEYVAFYRTGMSDFKRISSADIYASSTESYLYYFGMGHYYHEGYLNNKHILTFSIFPYHDHKKIEELSRQGYPKPEKLREVTFDLNTLTID